MQSPFKRWRRRAVVASIALSFCCTSCLAASVHVAIMQASLVLFLQLRLVVAPDSPREDDEGEAAKVGVASPVPAPCPIIAPAARKRQRDWESARSRLPTNISSLAAAPGVGFGLRSPSPSLALASDNETMAWPSFGLGEFYDSPFATATSAPRGGWSNSSLDDSGALWQTTGAATAPATSSTSLLVHDFLLNDSLVDPIDAPRTPPWPQAPDSVQSWRADSTHNLLATASSSLMACPYIALAAPSATLSSSTSSSPSPLALAQNAENSWPFLTSKQADQLRWQRIAEKDRTAIEGRQYTQRALQIYAAIPSEGVYSCASIRCLPALKGAGQCSERQDQANLKRLFEAGLLERARCSKPGFYNRNVFVYRRCGRK
jgi:hypothetical protein